MDIKDKIGKPKNVIKMIINSLKDDEERNPVKEMDELVNDDSIIYDKTRKNVK